MGTLEIIIITLLSIFQSIFGVGLLIIGTPIFLQSINHLFKAILQYLLFLSHFLSFIDT